LERKQSAAVRRDKKTKRVGAQDASKLTRIGTVVAVSAWSVTKRQRLLCRRRRICAAAAAAEQQFIRT